MNFSKTTKYALQTLALMAADPAQLFSAHALHTELKIPKKYLQALLTDLAKHGIVTSTRGKYGGFRIAKKTSKIFVSDVIEAVEGFNQAPVCFFGFEECFRHEPCPMHEKWAETQGCTIRILEATSLADLVEKKIK